jgi:cell division protein FtsB
MSTRRPNMPRSARPAGGVPGRGAAPAQGQPDPAATEPAGTSGAGVPGQGYDGGGEVLRLNFHRAGDSQQHPGQYPGGKRKPTPSEARLAARRQLAEGIRQPDGLSGAVISRSDPADAAGSGAAPGMDQPGGQARQGGRTIGDAKPVPAKAFSGRLLALAVVLVAITVMLAPTVKTFLQQQGEISALEAEIAQQQQSQEQLERQLARWDDPAYIKQQARDRLFLVMPGEKQYLVFGAEPGTGDVPESASDSAEGKSAEDLPWVDALWESVNRSATD